MQTYVQLVENRFPGSKRPVTDFSRFKRDSARVLDTGEFVQSWRAPRKFCSDSFFYAFTGKHSVRFLILDASIRLVEVPLVSFRGSCSHTQIRLILMLKALSFMT